MVDVGHAIDHTGIVLPEYGGNAFSRKFLQESLTGGLSLQGGSDSFLRLYGYGMSGNSLFAFHKFLLECLVAYAFTDLAGFDGYAGPFSFFIGSRIDQSMIGLSLYRLVGLFHRYMEKAKQGFKLLDGLELVSLHDGLDHIGYLMLDAEMMFLAELVPVFLLVLGQHKDDVDVGVVFVEALYGAHQDGLAGYRQKLLGCLCAHAQSFASGYNDYVIHNLSEE